MSTLFDLINSRRSKNSHIFGRPSTGKTSLALYKSERMIQEQQRVLYVDTHGSLNSQQVALIAPSLPQYVMTWSSFDNVIEALSTYNADHIILDDLAPFDIYKADEGFKSNFSAFIKRLGMMNVSIDVINQIRAKPGLDYPVPYYEDYVVNHFRNNIEIRRVQAYENGMIYQLLNSHTRKYIEVFIDNMGIVDEDYTVAAMLKQPATAEFREIVKRNRNEVFSKLINQYGFEEPQSWI